MKEEEPVASTSKLSSPFEAIGSSESGGGSVKDEFGESRPKLGRTDNEEVLIKRMAAARLTGIQHYGGIRGVHDGQRLHAKREKTNVFDPNAILILAADERTKCGHLNKELARKLASLIDEGKIRLAPFVNKAPQSIVGLKDIPISLELWGTEATALDARLDWLFPDRKKRKVAPMLIPDKLPSPNGQTDAVRAKKASNANGAKGKENASILGTNVEEVDMKPVGDVLGALFQAAGWDPMDLPPHPKPPGRRSKTMKTDLLPFQSQGLRWMIQMEHPKLPRSPSDPPSQLWVLKYDTANEPYYQNLATRRSQRERPRLRRGGILADEMGLGKTLQTIALICTDDTGEYVIDKPEDPDDRFDDLTLIVCPLSVASNWTTQLQAHVGAKRLKWHLYHGEGREISKKQLRSEYDVVIVPYNTLATEFTAAADAKTKQNEDEQLEEPLAKKAKTPLAAGTLHSIRWRRVVLDEGHTIKNPTTKMSIACANLRAERRWVLTGTPIINSSSDLGAMMEFLKLCQPLDNRDEWKQRVEIPIKHGDDAAKALLRAVVSSTTLRRTKDMKGKDGQPLVSLPQIKFYMHRVQLSPGTRELYDSVSQGVSGVVRDLLKEGGRSYTQLMVLLLRMRQIACHPTLCPESFITAVREAQVKKLLEAGEAGAGGSFGKHEPDQARLQNQLRQMTAEAGEDCALCRRVPSEARITICGHIFCLSCIESHIESEHDCPVCLRKLTTKELIGSPRGSEEPINEESEVSGRQHLDGLSSLAPLEAAKTNELVRLLRATDEGVKSLVFSQWTTHLNLIQEALRQAGIETCRFDGSMSQRDREDVIARFSQPIKPADQLAKGEQPSPPVMLISLRAGALGLNLTVASQVFLMDPWWQASIEQQAIDRVYRIGQKKPVRVFQLVADNTVEARVLEIQQKKNQLIEDAFSGTKRGSSASPEKIESRLDDLKAIFGAH